MKGYFLSELPQKIQDKIILDHALFFPFPNSPHEAQMTTEIYIYHRIVKAKYKFDLKGNRL